MGQYWKPVNLDKREYVNPHRLGSGLKLWEQLASHPGTGAALIILTAAMPEQRGGGDLDLEENWHGPEGKCPRHNVSPGPTPEDYPEIARRTIGRWAGDRNAIVGDYAERGDLPPEDHADLIYDLCQTEEERQETVDHFRELAQQVRESGGRLYGATAEEYEDKADHLAKAPLYRDVSDDVCAVIEHELHGRFVGEGWREFVIR